MPPISTTVPPAPASWTYDGRVARVVDGDTVDLDLALGACSLGPIQPGRLEDPALRPGAGAALDLGFHLVLGIEAKELRLVGRLRFRLMGYNAPELRGAEAPLGRIAAARLAELLPVGTPVTVETFKGDAFGRWLATVRIAGVGDIVDLLVGEGFGVRWDGRGDRPRFDPFLQYPLRPSQPLRP